MPGTHLHWNRHFAVPRRLGVLAAKLKLINRLHYIVKKLHGAFSLLLGGFALLFNRHQ